MSTLMNNTSSARSSITPPSFPKGGGALTGMGESLGQAGPTGMAEMTLPLPITTGRGFAPSLSLSYSSGSGNGVFGLGWSCSVPMISRRTSKGTPQYSAVGSNGPQDTFLGPDGEVLVPEQDSAGRVITVTTHNYGTIPLGNTYTVTRFLARTEGAFHRLEYWVDSNGRDFWLLHSRDGNLHMLGKTNAARIYDPSAPLHTAAWLLEESLSPTGDDIWYQYRAEDGANVSESGRDTQANRYLSQVSYGNQTACSSLFLWSSDAPPAEQRWLFTLVLDYGERTLDANTPPPFTPTGTWPTRPDAFSRYDYGFEVRTHRLCQQVLMYHHFPDEMVASDTLVYRLLLEYRSDAVSSQLTAAQSLAYEPDAASTLQQMPPLELTYTPFGFQGESTLWQSLPNFPGLDDGNPYHLVDLYGEGLPGVLYRAGPDWCYRAPIRAASGGDNVNYAPWQTLPQVPAMQGQRFQLLDITGDGHLDWVVAQPGLAGFFTLNADSSWGSFTPFDALPVEYFHPQSQLTQLVGSGLADLALIGPKSVRMYANQGSGFAVGIDVAHDNSLPLPVAGRDAQALVAFADILGSGQAHLVEIRYNQVRCWPNLGRGRFGAPVDLPLSAPIDSETAFNPENLFLADIDGSGTTDLIYAQHNQLTLCFNQSGNSFSSPQVLALPDGVTYDRLCQITLADMQGNGCVELVLTVPYTTPTHWRYPFVSQKPYLLASIANNLGASTQLTYRSSAQYWLDEKVENPTATPALPFPVQLLSQTLICDELTGNTLSSDYLYRQGVYDGKEREFRGFAYVELQDTNDDAQPSGGDTPLAAPLRTRNWYHCGRQDDEIQLYGAPFAGDNQAPTLNATLLTRYDADTGQDTPLESVDAETQWWLYRALKGSLLRSETWAIVGGNAPEAPYSCSYNRYQVRLVQASKQSVALPMSLEQVTINYEQLAQDPFIDHQVVLQQDHYAIPLWQVQVAYPRRASFTPDPYPENLPTDAWENTYDTQQQCVRLNESRVSVYHLATPDYTDTTTIPCWYLGLPAQQRQNLLTANNLPSGGISFETLTAKGGLLDPSQPRYLQGQSAVMYQSTPPTLPATPLPAAPTTLPALVYATRTAVLDQEAEQAYAGSDINVTGMPAFDAKNVGYTAWTTVLDVNGATTQSLWAVDSGFTGYDSAHAFYCPLTQQSTLLTGALMLTWDRYHLKIVEQTDVFENRVSAAYDYRFLQPCCVTDINGNIQELQFDALGRTLSNSVYGTENGGLAVGFDPVAEYPVSPSLTVEDAISNALSETYIQHTAHISATDMFSWMGKITPSDLNEDSVTALNNWQALLDNRYITTSGYIRVAGHQWALQPESNPGIPDSLAAVLAEKGGMPVHSVTLTADSYPPAPSAASEQQIQVALSYSDGFGRVLQQCVRVAPGDAWTREDDGEVNTQTVYAASRWAVSGRVEHDNKGQVVRTYQPFFINDWKYVVDNSLRTQGYCDTHYYDALGRESHTVTALGYLRRTTWYPWFTVAEDENDTQGLTVGDTL